MTDDFAASIGQEQSFNDPEFFVGVLPSPSVKTYPDGARGFREDPRSGPRLPLTQLGHLLHRLW